MKALTLILTFGLALATVTSVDAAGTRKSKAAKSSKNSKASKVNKSSARANLSTDIKFSDHDLFGRYQVPEEALTRVENEKVLTDVLGVRRHFKDRLLEASEQE